MSGHPGTLPWEPLASLLGDIDDTTAAERLGIHRRSIIRYRAGALIQRRRADRYAIAVGSHPALIWGDDWSDR